jgi:hypothetical protein
MSDTRARARSPRSAAITELLGDLRRDHEPGSPVATHLIEMVNCYATSSLVWSAADFCDIQPPPLSVRWIRDAARDVMMRAVGAGRTPGYLWCLILKWCQGDFVDAGACSSEELFDLFE